MSSLKSFYPRPDSIGRGSPKKMPPPKDTVADLESAAGAGIAPLAPEPKESKPSLEERFVHPSLVYVPAREEKEGGEWAYFHQLDVGRTLAQNLSPEDLADQEARNMLTARLAGMKQRQVLSGFDYAAHFNRANK